MFETGKKESVKTCVFAQHTGKVIPSTNKQSLLNTNKNKSKDEKQNMGIYWNIFSIVMLGEEG